MCLLQCSECNVVVRLNAAVGVCGYTIMFSTVDPWLASYFTARGSRVWSLAESLNPSVWSCHAFQDVWFRMCRPSKQFHTRVFKITSFTNCLKKKFFIFSVFFFFLLQMIWSWQVEDQLMSEHCAGSVLTCTSCKKGFRPQKSLISHLHVWRWLISVVIWGKMEFMWKHQNINAIVIKYFKICCLDWRTVTYIIFTL